MNWESIKEWFRERSPYIYIFMAAVLACLIAVVMLVSLRVFHLLIIFIAAAFFFLISVLAYKFLFDEPDRIRLILGNLLCAFLILGAVYIIIEIQTYSNLPVAHGKEDVVLKDNSAAIFALQSTGLENPEDFAGKKVGVLKNENEEVRKKAEEWLNAKDAKIEIVEYGSSEQLARELKGVLIDGMILKENHVEKLEKYPDMENFLSTARVVYEYELETAETNEAQLEPVSVLISFADQYSTPTEGQPANTNIVLTVNPSSKTLLATLVPGSYIPASTDQEKETGGNLPVSQMGGQGSQALEKEIATLLNTPVDGVVLSSFSSLDSLVSSLGGIKIYADQEFGAGSQYFAAGESLIQGWQAPSLLQNVWSGYTKAASKDKNIMRLLQGLQHSVSALNDPAAAVNLIISQTANDLDPAQTEKYIQNLSLMPSDWNYYVNALTGTEESSYSSALGYYITGLKGTEMTQKRAASSIQAVLNGEIPEYTSF